jgi:hypothetical protein
MVLDLVLVIQALSLIALQVVVVEQPQLVVMQLVTQLLVLVVLVQMFLLGLDSLLAQPTRVVAVVVWLTATLTGVTQNQETLLVA